MCSDVQEGGYERDPDWRPLTVSEVAYFSSISNRKLWAFMGETAPESAYWRTPPKTKSQ